MQARNMPPVLRDALERSGFSIESPAPGYTEWLSVDETKTQRVKISQGNERGTTSADLIYDRNHPVRVVVQEYFDHGWHTMYTIQFDANPAAMLHFFSYVVNFNA